MLFTACIFCHRRSVILKILCFITIHWSHSWGGLKCMVPPNLLTEGWAPTPVLPPLDSMLAFYTVASELQVKKTVF